MHEIMSTSQEIADKLNPLKVENAAKENYNHLEAHCKKNKLPFLGKHITAELQTLQNIVTK